MTKGKLIEVIEVPHGEWARSICEDCQYVQSLTIDKTSTLVCTNKKCRLFKAVVRRYGDKAGN